MNKVKWIEAEGFLVVIVSGKEPKTITSTSEIYSGVKQAIAQQNEDRIRSLLFPEEIVEKQSNGAVKMSSTGIATIAGKETDPAIAKMIKDFTAEKLPYEPLIFLQKNIDSNDNDWIRGQIFRFLEKNRVALTADGCFVCYKGVERNGDGDLVDCHSKSFINNVGSIVRMNKSDVNLDPHQTCSAGLHVAGYQYVGSVYSSGVKIAVKVNPKHVCSVPYDYEDQKMRTCEYQVIALMGEEREMEHLYYPWDKVLLNEWNEKVVKEKPIITKKSAKLAMVDLVTFSANAIIDYVLKATKKIIPVSPKSKKSVVAHASRLLSEAGFRTEGTMAEVIPDQFIFDTEKTVTINGLSASQVVDIVEEMTGEKITFNLKSKSSIITAATRILLEHGYKAI